MALWDQGYSAQNTRVSADRGKRDTSHTLIW